MGSGPMGFLGFWVVGSGLSGFWAFRVGGFQDLGFRLQG